ncbi:MAG: triacylglycerol lipase [Deltaproteobacteria bacterium]|nr:triacylglycerol lipase [Deltaproteobacteria bacterium]
MVARPLLARLLLPCLLSGCGEERLVDSGGGGGPAHTADDAGTGTARSLDDPQMVPLVPEPVQPVRVHDGRRGPPYPVVLAHGLNGFRDVGPVDYYFRVPGALQDAGVEVYVTAVAPYDGSTARARALAAEIDRILAQSGAARVNIIAHSQGGIDSRYLISTLGYGDRVASLTTISTPHRGTHVADLIAGGGVVAVAIADAWAWLFGELSRDTVNDPNSRAALETLSTAGMEAFNRANPDDPRVRYFSFAGRSNLQKADAECGAGERGNPDAVDTIEPALLPTWAYLADSLTDPVPNDGLVTVPSARWGRFMGCLPADHADEIGQLADLFPDLVSGWDHVGFYVEWVAYLRGLGL